MIRPDKAKWIFCPNPDKTTIKVVLLIPKSRNRSAKICGNHCHGGAGFELEVVGLHVEIQKKNGHQYRQERDHQENGVQIGPGFAEVFPGIVTRFWRRHGHLSALRFAGNWG